LPGPELRAYLPQRSQDLRSIEALSVTVFAEIRHRLIPPTPCVRSRAHGV
jgi:hypothetical protein